MRYCLPSVVVSGKHVDGADGEAGFLEDVVVVLDRLFMGIRGGKPEGER